MPEPVFQHRNRVAFADTDASGWVHFPKFFRFAEEAEHAFLRERGLLVFDRAQGGWPRVNVSCDFLRPLLFGDEVETRLTIQRVGTSSIAWGFEIVHLASGETSARGAMTTVLVDATGKPRTIGDDQRAALG